MKSENESPCHRTEVGSRFQGMEDGRGQGGTVHVVLVTAQKFTLRIASLELQKVPLAPRELLGERAGCSVSRSLCI